VAQRAQRRTADRDRTERNGHRQHGEAAEEIRDYTDLLAWQRARRLVRRIYAATSGFPAAERFGLTQQVRRAAVSVASNIAEGYGRGSLQDYIRFLQMARGSLYEVQTQVILAEDLGFIAHDAARALGEEANECARLLQGLLKSLKKSQPQ
jgi:four helix bundle protein